MLYCFLPARPLCVDAATLPTSPLVRVSEPARLPQEGHEKLANHSFMGKQTIVIMNTSTVFLMQTLQIKEASDEAVQFRSKRGFSLVSSTGFKRRRLDEAIQKTEVLH